MEIFCSDWLASTPFFYNEKTNKYGFNINDVIDYSNVDWHSEGLLNYLDFGYSVFGQTPIKNVKFLRSNQKLILKDGALVVEEMVDDSLNYLSKKIDEKEIWDLIRENLSSHASRYPDQKILIPTSGGYDSRLLNFLYPKHENIIACSFGISQIQNESYEVVFAKAICDKLGIFWNAIDLGRYHQYFEKWIDLYGPSVHAHGMYQYEFYTKIKAQFGSMPMLSGIVGDGWAGAITDTVAPLSPEDLIRLGLSRGLHADSSQCLVQVYRELRDEEFVSQKKLLIDERYRIIYLIRSKMILLSYLLAVPRSLGFSAESPFLDKNIALSMLNLKQDRWKNRVWQKEFIKVNGLDIERNELKKSYRNDLELIAMQQDPLRPLGSILGNRLFKREYIDWINSNISMISKKNMIRNRMYLSKYGFSILRRLGFSNQTRQAYAAYLVLRPIESILIKANL